LANSLWSVKESDSELTQYRKLLGGEPSSKTCPRCASQRAQRISVRTMPKLRSSCVITFSAATGWKKLGHPVPELNLASDAKSGKPQQMQL